MCAYWTSRITRSIYMVTPYLMLFSVMRMMRSCWLFLKEMSKRKLAPKKKCTDGWYLMIFIFLYVISEKTDLLSAIYLACMILKGTKKYIPRPTKLSQNMKAMMSLSRNWCLHLVQRDIILWRCSILGDVMYMKRGFILLGIF